MTSYLNFITAVTSLRFISAGNCLSSRAPITNRIQRLVETPLPPLPETRDPEELAQRLLRYVSYGYKRGIPTMKLLLEAGVNVNCCSAFSKHTPLHAAVIASTAPSYPWNSLSELLLYHGANVDALDAFQRTPLDYADCKDVFLVLIEAGATIGSPMTALGAVTKNWGKYFSILLESKLAPKGFDDCVGKVLEEYFLPHSLEWNVKNMKKLLKFLKENHAFVIYRIIGALYKEPRSASKQSWLETRKFEIIDVYLTEISKGTYLYSLPVEIISDILLSKRRLHQIRKMENMAWNLAFLSYKLGVEVNDVKAFVTESITELLF